MATVAGLTARGVSPSDVTVVVRDADQYEDPLRRAANRYGVTLNFWIQLRLKRTLPYRLAVAVVNLLVAREESDLLPADALLAPLRFQWTPPEATSPEAEAPDTAGDWPLSAETVEALSRRVAGERHRVAAWRNRIGDVTGGDSRFDAYVEWLDGCPSSPDPDDVRETLVPLFDAYRKRVLPMRQADDATLTETARTARALARLVEDGDGLVGELAVKYRSWLDDDYGEQSWATVRELCDALATTVPGRREYPTARAVDVMEANDVWGLSIPYVIVAGLVDGEWPRPPDSEFPAGFRERVSDTEGVGENVRPRSGWTEGREFDQFADAVVAASEALVVTRHEYDFDGVERPPSPYVRLLDPTPVDDPEVDTLLAERQLPPRLAAISEEASN